MFVFGHAIKFRKHRWCGQADIFLHGLTVITGGNDLGKSTISKMLYSMVKAVAFARGSCQDHRHRDLNKHVEYLYRYIGRN